MVWLSNALGASDLFCAVYQGPVDVRIAPGALGAALFIPTVVV